MPRPRLAKDMLWCRLPDGVAPHLPSNVPSQTACHAGGLVQTGSHTDAIPLAGAYDGTLGVLGGIAALRALHAAGFRPQRGIEVIMFTSEEPTRFALGCSGRSALAPGPATSTTCPASACVSVSAQHQPLGMALRSAWCGLRSLVAEPRGRQALHRCLTGHCTPALQRMVRETHRCACAQLSGWAGPAAAGPWRACCRRPRWRRAWTRTGPTSSRPPRPRAMALQAPRRAHARHATKLACICGQQAASSDRYNLGMFAMMMGVAPTCLYTCIICFMSTLSAIWICRPQSGPCTAAGWQRSALPT